MGTHIICATVSVVVIVFRYRWGFGIDSLVHLLVWSNFEIADMDFWRGEAYTKYFEYLDSTGGFYYEVR